MIAAGIYKAALASAAAVFVVGFVFGVVRNFVLIPGVGALAAVLIELPFMLAASALIWRWSLSRYRVPQDTAKRLLTGLGSFAVLMVLEFALNWVITQAGPMQYIKAVANPAGLLGLMGQIAFAAMPLALPTRAGKP